MDGFQRELLGRLPLAQAVLGLFAYALDDTFLNRVFEENRGRCYEAKLTFPTLVGLIRDALILHAGSGRAGAAGVRRRGPADRARVRTGWAARRVRGVGTRGVSSAARPRRRSSRSSTACACTAASSATSRSDEADYR